MYYILWTERTRHTSENRWKSYETREETIRFLQDESLQYDPSVMVFTPDISEPVNAVDFVNDWVD